MIDLFIFKQFSNNFFSCEISDILASEAQTI